MARPRAGELSLIMDAAARDIAPPEPVYADGDPVAAAPVTTRATTRTPWALPTPVAELD